MTEFFREIGTAAAFDRAKAAKADLFRGATLFAGLNCFEPGQGQTVHAHAGADAVADPVGVPHTGTARQS